MRHGLHRSTAEGPAHRAGPVPVSASAEPWPLHGVAASRAIEARALATAPGGSLMQQAGEAVARWALALHPHARRVRFYCGPGGNGGDGLHAARVLRQRGLEVQALICCDPARLRAQTRAALQAAQDAGVSIGTTPAADDAWACDLNIDALTGLGPARPQGALALAVKQLRSSPAPCLSVDLPTGLDGDTGAVWDGPAVRAQATLALLTLKPGLFTASGRDHGGAVWFDSLLGRNTPQALDIDGAAPTWLAGAPDPRRLGLLRQHAHHKGSFGEVYVIGGASGMGGALLLAAHAALAAGAGRVIAVPLGDPSPMGDPTRPEIIWRAARQILDRPQSLAQATVVCGCGAGDEAAHVLPLVLSRSARAVLDADALNQIARDSALLQMLAARAHRGLATILTPHPLEAARLLGCEVAQVQADRLGAARRLCEASKATVVLKGSGTVTAHPARPALINPTGSAALAVPGSGDVLAGWMGGWCSQAARSSISSEAEASVLAHEIAWASVWAHGRAAEIDGDRVLSGDAERQAPLHTPCAPVQALRAADLIERLRQVELDLRTQAGRHRRLGP